MKTTLDIDDELLVKAKAISARERKSLTCLIEEGLRLRLRGSREPKRSSTNSKLFASPTPIAAAVSFVDSLLAIPGVEMPELGREWPTLRQLSCDLKLDVKYLLRLAGLSEGGMTRAAKQQGRA